MRSAYPGTVGEWPTMSLFSLTEADLRARTSLKWQTYGPDVLPLWVAEMDAMPLSIAHWI